MTFRAICLGLAALVLTTAGCLPYHRHPCWGFRLRPCQTGGGDCGACAPAWSSPIHHPILHRLAHHGHDCPACIGGGATIATPAVYPSTSYPPVIGEPVPLHHPTIVPSDKVPNPMPVKPSGY
jgi:hypothetical protein